MKRFAILILIILCGASTATGLTMQEAVDSALKNNNKLIQYKNLTQSAKAAVGASRASLMPTVGLSYSYIKSSELAYNPNDAYSVFTAVASYNLFNGFSDSARFGKAESDALAAMYLEQATRADTILMAKSSYIAVLVSKRTLETSREAVQLLKKQKADAELYYSEGLLAKNDFLRVEVELAAALQTMLEAEGNLRTSLRKLESFCGLSLQETPDELEDFSDIPSYDQLVFEALRDQMLSSRSELLYLRSKIKAGKFGQKAVFGTYLPKVDVSISYNTYGESMSPSGRETPYDKETKTMLSANWLLFDGFGRSSSNAQLKYLIRASEQELKDTQNNLVQQLRETLEGYKVSKGQLGVAEKAISQAQENYRVTDNQFRERVATTTDLINARILLTRAKNNYNAALYSLHLSSAQIQRVIEQPQQK